MWALTVDSGSLLSVVQFDPKKAPAMAMKHGASDPEETYLLVRSRIKASLGYVADVLEAIYAGEAEGWQRPIIDEDKKADYKYRTIVTPNEWKKFLCYEVDGIDYSSHVKEETVKRQPEPKVANLYSALSATWSAWAKLQDTPPYGGYTGTYYTKPDCKNCGHREISHSVKGDKCNFGSKWEKGKYVGSACNCAKYEPKPTPPPPAPKSPVQTALPVGSGGKDPVYAPNSVALEDADGEHAGWCPFFDGDPCLCADDLWEGEYEITHPSVDAEYPSLAQMMAELDERDIIEAEAGLMINGMLVMQEPAVPGETASEKKQRMRRNKQRRRNARKTPQTN